MQPTRKIQEEQALNPAAPTAAAQPVEQQGHTWTNGTSKPPQKPLPPIPVNAEAASTTISMPVRALPKVPAPRPLTASVIASSSSSTAPQRELPALPEAASSAAKRPALPQDLVLSQSSTDSPIAFPGEAVKRKKLPAGAYALDSGKVIQAKPLIVEEQKGLTTLVQAIEKWKTENNKEIFPVERLKTADWFGNKLYLAVDENGWKVVQLSLKERLCRKVPSWKKHYESTFLMTVGKKFAELHALGKVPTELQDYVAHIQKVYNQRVGSKDSIYHLPLNEVLSSNTSDHGLVLLSKMGQIATDVETNKVVTEFTQDAVWVEPPTDEEVAAAAKKQKQQPATTSTKSHAAMAADPDSDLEEDLVLPVVSQPSSSSSDAVNPRFSFFNRQNKPENDQRPLFTETFIKVSVSEEDSFESSSLSSSGPEEADGDQEIAAEKPVALEIPKAESEPLKDPRHNRVRGAATRRPPTRKR